MLGGPEGTSLDSSWCSFPICGFGLARLGFGLDLEGSCRTVAVIAFVFGCNPKGLTTGNIAC